MQIDKVRIQILVILHKVLKICRIVQLTLVFATVLLVIFKHQIELFELL